MIRIIYADNTSARMRWTDQHADSSYGLGVLLYARSSNLLDGEGFRALADQGARIECDDDRERRRVAGALAWPALGLSDDKLAIRVG